MARYSWFTAVFFGAAVVLTACQTQGAEGNTVSESNDTLTQTLVQGRIEELLRRTVDGLPAGTMASKIVKDIAVNFLTCDEQPTGPSVRVMSSDQRWLMIPGGMPKAELMDAVAAIWSTAGWRVGRNDPRMVQPNVTAAADGYLLLLRFGGPNGDEPAVGVTSPCYLRSNSDNNVPFTDPIVHS